MKFLLGQGFLVIMSVIILYYLFNTTEFLPYLSEGEINWQNIVVLIFFIATILVNMTSMLYILINKIFLRREIDRKLIYSSLKIGGILFLGILIIVILNFLHILNIYYGFGALTLVILLLLVI
ncbi:TPA: hypothetical protein DEP90_03630 [Patescibacteria group bacterium]|nr:hypothetical protein [Patescibacteria group bacterium]